MTISYRTSRWIPVLSAIVLALSNLTGCGKSGPSISELAIDQAVSLGDAAYNPRAFASYFVEGSVPPNRGDYARLRITVSGEPEIAGQSAKVPVTLTVGPPAPIEGGLRPSSGGLQEGTIKTTWTLKKVGQGWKIAAAPLS